MASIVNYESAKLIVNKNKLIENIAKTIILSRNIRIFGSKSVICRLEDENLQKTACYIIYAAGLVTYSDLSIFYGVAPQNKL